MSSSKGLLGMPPGSWLELRRELPPVAAKVDKGQLFARNTVWLGDERRAGWQVAGASGHSLWT